MNLEKLSEVDVSRTADTWEYVTDIRRSISEHIQFSISAGGIPDPETITKNVYDDTREIGELSSVSLALQQKWINILSRGSNSTFKQYDHYLETKFSSREDVQNFLQKQKISNFLTQLIHSHPIVGLTATSLLRRESSQAPEREYAGWYSEVIQTAENIEQDIHVFFAVCMNRLRGTQQNEILQPFLEDWKNDVLLTLGECINMANCFAIHAQQEDCAVFMTSTPFPYKGKGRTNVEHQIHSLQSFPVYQKYYNSFFDAEFSKKGYAYIPSMISVVDILEFLKFLERYWAMLSTSIEKGGSYPLRRGHKEKIALKGAVTALCRPEAENGKQARIALCAEAAEFQGFDLRIDKERDGALSFDFGNINFDDAFYYAEEIGKRSNQEEVIMKYSALVDDTGNLYPTRASKKEYYPSIMRNSGSLVKGKRASLVSAVAANAGEQMGMRENAQFSYHFKEHVTYGIKERGHSFNDVVTLFSKMLRQKTEVIQ